MTTRTETTPLFRTHSNLRATVRGATLVSLVAALAIGFVADVWHAPTPAVHGSSAAALASGRS